ncbi:hypothetical protein F9859_03585, partial [Glaesserella parasuis]|nr:hypothetical protein [Glaesserella parasuis]
FFFFFFFDVIFFFFFFFFFFLFFFPYFWILFLRQKGQFFVHISKSGLKALYYKALAHFFTNTFVYYA